MITPEEMQANILKLIEASEASKVESRNRAQQYRNFMLAPSSDKASLSDFVVGIWPIRLI